MQGGISCGYKNSVQEKGLPDETYPGTGVALVRINGTSIHNNKTVQVDAVWSTSTCAYLIPNDNISWKYETVFNAYFYVVKMTYHNND